MCWLRTLHASLPELCTRCAEGKGLGRQRGMVYWLWPLRRDLSDGSMSARVAPGGLSGLCPRLSARDLLETLGPSSLETIRTLIAWMNRTKAGCDWSDQAPRAVPRKLPFTAVVSPLKECLALAPAAEQVALLTIP